MNRPRDRASTAGLLPRMEARPRKDGLTTYRYHPLGGKPVTLGTDKGAAIRKVLDMNGRAGDEGTVGNLWRLYKESPGYKRLAASTQRLYGELWDSLAKGWEKGAVAAIRPADVARWLRVARADAPIVANREVAVLSNLFNLAVERGDIERNPCREVRRNPEDPRTRLVEKSEFDPFIAWALKRGDSATVIVSMAEFAALTGNRRAEFRTLHWPQVDAEVIRLTRAKQRGNREKRELVAVSEALAIVMDA
jgi:integrase